MAETNPTRAHAARRPTRWRAGLAVVALVGLTTACQPGITWGVAGSAGTGTTGDTGPATAATLTAPGPLVAIPGGGFYVADTTDCVIRKVDNAGIITTVAGTAGTCGDTGDGGPATKAEINTKVFQSGLTANLAVDTAGNLYFLQFDSPASSVREIATDGTITTLSGAAALGWGITAQPNGTIIWGDSTGGGSTSELVTRSPDGTLVTQVIAGNPICIGLADLHDGRFAAFCEAGPFHLAPGVYRIDAATGSVTLAGSTGTVFAPVASASDGTIYTVNSTHHVLRIDPDNTVTVIAGDGYTDSGGYVQSGMGTDLRLSPVGLAATPNNGLLIASGQVVYRLDHPELAGS